MKTAIIDLQEAIIKHCGTADDFQIALDIIEKEYRPILELSLPDKLELLGKLFDVGMTSDVAGNALCVVLKKLAKHNMTISEMVDILNNAKYTEYYALNLFGIRESAAALYLSKHD